MTSHTPLCLAGPLCQQNWRGTNRWHSPGRRMSIMRDSLCPATTWPGFAMLLQIRGWQAAAVSPPRQEAGHED